MAEFNPRILHSSTVEELWAEMEKIGAETEGLEIMAPKGLFRALKLEGVEAGEAKGLKEGMLALGGEAVLSQAAYRDEAVTTDVLLLGTLSHYQRLTTKLHDGSSLALMAIADALEQALANYEGQSLQALTIGPTTFEWGKRTYIMGIVNVTPDSFSGDGLAGDVEAAVAQAKRFVEEGADILDVGGESTRPGAEPVPAEEELRRVLPVVGGIARETGAVICIDTYKAEVARRALDAGAHMVNDVWGLRLDPDLAPLVAERGVPVVIMHNRSTPKAAAWVARLGGRYEGVKYQDLMADVIRELRQGLARALEAGIARERIIVDPGIGFGKTTAQNLTLLNRLDELRVLGCPILAGPSRKSFIGYTLDLPLDQRLEGTAATVVLCIDRGADIVRVHDVREMVRVARMTDAVVRG
jgi:dihydropteroate synthase